MDERTCWWVFLLAIFSTAQAHGLTAPHEIQSGQTMNRIVVTCGLRRDIASCSLPSACWVRSRRFGRSNEKALARRKLLVNFSYDVSCHHKTN